MWKQFIDKWKSFFDSEEEETRMEESEPQETKRPASTYRSSEVKSKMTYHYPKTGSFRFPVIPDETEDRKPRPQRQRQKTTDENKDKAKERYRKEDYQSRNSSKTEQKKEYARPVPSEEPFKPTSVPSPVHGFRQQTPAMEEKVEQERDIEDILRLKKETSAVPQPETPSVTEENTEEGDSLLQEQTEVPRDSEQTEEAAATRRE
ncbi:hypothetical protein U0355_05180 [Salimicrobium sp. PL1-032A]|uniref:hypothetical protein n=1 Tax=Salimicrobium sp. PL1-032A TaxID=3095364 RepID=UPI0032607BE1